MKAIFKGGPLDGHKEHFFKDPPPATVDYNGRIYTLLTVEKTHGPDGVFEETATYSTE